MRGAATGLRQEKKKRLAYAHPRGGSLTDSCLLQHNQSILPDAFIAPALGRALCQLRASSPTRVAGAGTERAASRRRGAARRPHRVVATTLWRGVSSLHLHLPLFPTMDSTTTTTYYYQVPARDAARAQKGAPDLSSLWSSNLTLRTHYVLVAAPPSSPPTYLSSCCSKSGEPTRPPAVGSCTGDLTTHSTQSWA